MAVQTRCTITPYAETAGGSFAVTLHGWNGWIPVMQNLMDEYTRLGQTGSGAQVLGRRGRKKGCTGWQGFTTEAAAKAFAEQWEGLEGRIVRVVDSYSRNMPRVRLTNVSAEVRAGKGPVTSGATQVSHRVECTVDCERLPDT